MQCLYPDCFDTALSDDPEIAKRQIIDHINQAHDDAHVLIACAHDMTHLEDFEATTRSGDTNAEIVIPQQRFQCGRCGQYEVRSVEH